MPIRVRYVLAVGSGLVGAAAFLPLGWWPLILVAWPLLFVALRGAGLRHGRYLGLVQGILYYGVGLSWMDRIFQQAAWGLWLILALFGWLAGAVIGQVSVKQPRLPWLALYAALVCSAVEYVRAELFWLRFPWQTYGLGLGPTWLSPWIGVYGAGFLVLLAGGMLVSGRKFQGLAGGALTLALLALGCYRPAPVSETTPPVPVLAVQNESSDFFACYDMTAARPFSKGIILWPEYAASYDLQNTPKPFEMARELTRERDATLILGTEKDLGGEAHYNQALTLEAGAVVGSHYKNHPVPFMNDGVAGRVAAPVTTRFGNIGTPICFDCDFTECVRRMTAAGAEAFAVPSMDAARWPARQHLQHAEIFRHRALENHRWMIVCASSGLTQLIDPHGNRVAQLPILQDGILETALFLRSDTTFFTRAGWLLPWVICALALLATAFLYRSALTRSPPTPAAAAPRPPQPARGLPQAPRRNHTSQSVSPFIALPPNEPDP